MTKLIQLETSFVFVKSRLCSDCKGHCCKTLPGITSPLDWGAPDKKVMEHRLREAFASGRYSIDYWEAGTPLYFVRPATKTNTHGVVDPSWGGECVFLSSTGCTLKHKNRPLGCRALEPHRDNSTLLGFSCEEHAGGKHEMGLAWKPYIHVLEQATGITL